MLPIYAVLLILFFISLSISSIGFKKFVWFLSIGYGLSIVGCGVFLIILYLILNKLNITSFIAIILLIIYGFRLGGFLLLRELKSKSYQKTLREVTQKTIPTFVKICIWISCSLLYVFQVSGIMFVIELNDYNSFFDTSILEIIGVIVMILGIILETIADNQKSKYKKIDSKKPAMNGLYKIQRCPNYSAEIIMWTGVLLFFFSSTTKAKLYMFIISILAYISIVYVMLNGAKRLEKRQERNYANLEEFIEYKKKTPLIFILFIPIKSLLNSKIIK